MVGDVTCSPCQGEGRRFEPGVPLQLARTPRTWRVRAFSWPSPFKATPPVHNGCAEWSCFEKNRPIGGSPTPFTGGSGTRMEHLRRALVRQFRPVVGRATGQAVTIRDLRTYANRV